jgi:SAM-dependent methyltransferase
MGRFRQVIMIDGSMSLLRQAVEKTRGQAVYIACDVTRLPFRAASFDAVLLIRVFHHIPDSPAFLAEMHRLLSSQGQFVFSYLNKRNLKRIIKWLVGANKENPFSTEPGGVGTTMMSHHPTAVKRMLTESGFSKMQVLGAGVLDRFFGRVGLEGKWIAIAERCAAFFAWSQMAPWILCRAAAQSHTSLIESQELSELLQCPACGGKVSGQKHEWLCQTCKRCYPVVDGIIDFRLH